MFWSKKFKEMSEYADEWKVMQGKLNEKPIFSRYKVSLLDAVGHPKYPFQIGVAIPLLNPTEDGLTTDPEAEELWKIEDEVAKILEENSEAVHAVSITFNGMRELVFYTSEWKPQYFEQRVKQIQADGSISKGHQLQFMMQQDKNWETFRKHSGN